MTSTARPCRITCSRRAQSILGFGQTITLYDQTYRYFEGIAAGVNKVKRWDSKESRGDCPLVTFQVDPLVEGHLFISVLA